MVLHPDHGGAPHEDSWNFRSVVGKLNFLAQNTCPDTSMAMHQCAHFCSMPMLLHEKAVINVSGTISPPPMTNA